MYRSTLSLTSALEGVGAQRQAPAASPPPREDPVPIVEVAGWAPEPVWTGAENLAPHRDSISGPSIPWRVLRRRNITIRRRFKIMVFRDVETGSSVDG